MSIWQTQSWQDMLIASGQSDEYFMIEQNVAPFSSGRERIQDRDTAAEGTKKIFVEKRRVSLGEYGLFVIGFEGELDSDTRESLEELCREENCLFLQIETINYAAPFSSGRERSQDRDIEGVKRKGDGKYYKKFIPPYTALIDLIQSEEDILAVMKPKGRYNIKLARKKGVVVEQVEKHMGNIQIFHELMSETTSRDNFAGNTLEYYKVFLESLDNAQLFFAYHEEDVIAAGIFVESEGIMTYYYGASSGKKRNLMAPYLLQWSVIEHAKKRNCKMYDFLGVAGDDEKNSSLAGVTDFKMKLCPQKTLVSKSYLSIHKKWRYRIIEILKKIKR